MQWVRRIEAIAAAESWTAFVLLELLQIDRRGGTTNPAVCFEGDGGLVDDRVENTDRNTFGFAPLARKGVMDVRLTGA